MKRYFSGFIFCENSTNIDASILVVNATRVFNNMLVVYSDFDPKVEMRCKIYDLLEYRREEYRFRVVLRDNADVIEV